MRAVLSIYLNDAEKCSFSIVRDTTVIGRDLDCDLRIPLSRVSRHHCKLVREGNAMRLLDTGSSNGTFINGARVEDAVLSPGDRIGVGPVTLVVRFDGISDGDELALDPGASATEVPDFDHIEDDAPKIDDDSLVDFSRDDLTVPSPDLGKPS
jgi:pSer/pThr/pTyr-binding forkhead associated (FHA) protein